MFAWLDLRTNDHKDMAMGSLFPNFQGTNSMRDFTFGKTGAKN